MPCETTLQQLVAAQATRTPRATALIRGKDRLTYGELDAWARAIAGQLARRGVRLEDRVGICAAIAEQRPSPSRPCETTRSVAGEQTTPMSRQRIWPM